jgi:hydroxymethylpyrimidine pyrophosphatase-like HAD family hydrolase
VAENGALVYCPATREEKILGDPPPERFVQALHARGVRPIALGRVIVATQKPHETAVLEAIRDLGLELHVTFNKDAVMVLPAGLTKASGLAEALLELGLSPHNVVGVGDAENDHAFLRLCECRVAVANALPMLKEPADLVTHLEDGAGVRELIDRLLAADLRDLEPRLARHNIMLGIRNDGTEVVLRPGGSALLAEPGTGTSTLSAGILERFAHHEYQFCVVDPEGNDSAAAGAIVLGDSQRKPSLAEVCDVLAKPSQNVVVSLQGIALERRPAFFNPLLAKLQELRNGTGRPHWIIVEEADKVLPASSTADLSFPGEPSGMLFTTAHPDLMASSALPAVDLTIAVGQWPHGQIRAWASRRGLQTGLEPTTLVPGEGIGWDRIQGSAAFRFQLSSPRETTASISAK